MRRDQERKACKASVFVEFSALKSQFLYSGCTQNEVRANKKRGVRGGETFFPSFVFITLVLIPGGKTATNGQIETLAAQAKERREDNSVEVTDSPSGTSYCPIGGWQPRYSVFCRILNAEHEKPNPWRSYNVKCLP